MAMASSLTIAASNLPLDFPIVNLGDKFCLFGDIDVARQYQEGDEQHVLKPYEYGERLLGLLAQENTDLLTRNDDSGVAVRHGSYVLKYCWDQAPAIYEAVASEAMRIGLEHLAREGHGICVPRVIGGISSRTSGILITEYVPGYTAVVNLDRASRQALADDRPRRKIVYERATAISGFTPAVNNLGRKDDTEHNILWPRDFVPSFDQPLPESMVRLDFGKSAKYVRNHVSWPVQRI